MGLNSSDRRIVSHNEIDATMSEFAPDGQFWRSSFAALPSVQLPESSFLSGVWLVFNPNSHRFEYVPESEIGMVFNNYEEAVGYIHKFTTMWLRYMSYRVNPSGDELQFFVIDNTEGKEFFMNPFLFPWRIFFEAGNRSFVTFHRLPGAPEILMPIVRPEVLDKLQKKPSQSVSVKIWLWVS